MIYFQDKILNQINNSTIDTWSHSIILDGPINSGKQDIAKYIAEKLNLQFINYIDIYESKSMQSYEELNDILFVNPNLWLCFIDFNLLSGNSTGDTKAKTQNKFLKYLEEPLKNCFMVISTTDSNNILPAIKNRCQILKLEKYSKKQLESLLEISNNDILTLARTPNDISLLKNTDLQSLLKLVNTMVNKIGTANFANTLTISNKINFKDDYDKFDYYLFLRALLNEFKKAYLNTNDNRYYSCFNLVRDLIDESIINGNLNKLNLFETLLISLRGILSGN